VNTALDDNIVRCKILLTKEYDAIIELYFLLVYVLELYNILNPAIVYDLENNHASAYEKLNGHKDTFIHQTIKANIARGVKSGLHRTDFNIEIIARFFLESLAIISNPTVFTPIHHQRKSTDELFVCLISGIVTATGTDIVNAYKNQRDITLLGNYEDQPFWDH
jgi:hypothetical protein